MRFKSDKKDGFQIFAVTGINTISFAIQATATAKRDLLGFAVERSDPAENQRFFMPGFKVFRSVIPLPNQDTHVSTFEHPVQSLVWDDFTGKPEREYEYIFHPIRGEPRNLDRSAEPITIKVRTEPLFSQLEHDVFFNRWLASGPSRITDAGLIRNWARTGVRKTKNARHSKEIRAIRRRPIRWDVIPFGL